MAKSKQPNFALIFRQTFAGPPKKVRYEIRSDSNRYHDVIFLSSLIHDARFRLADVRLRRGRLTIPLERDCWEIPLTEEHREVHIAKAELVIGPVVKSEWTSDPLYDSETPGQLGYDAKEWLDYLWIERTSFEDSDTGRIVLQSTSSKWILTVAEEGLTVRLRDLEVPYLYSSRSDQPV